MQRLLSALAGNYNASSFKGRDRGATVKALNAAGVSISSTKYEGVMKGNLSTLRLSSKST